MDLRILKETIEARDVIVAAHGSFSAQEHAGQSLTQEIFAKHRNGTQPESQHICIILSSILEVIASEGLQPTPTAIFAALISSLQQHEISSPSVLTTAIFNLLSSVLVRVPNQIIRSRCVQGTAILVNIIETCNDEDVARAAIAPLSQFMASMSSQDWPALSRGFNIILTACINDHAKLRKKAHSGVVDIMAALQTVPAALGSASDAILKLCQRILPGPHTAAHAAAVAPSKKRQQAEEVITVAVKHALHAMNLLQLIIPLIRGQETKAICALLLKLYPLQQQLLTRHATDTIAALCGSSATHLSPKDLSDILTAVVSADSTWDAHNADSILSFLRLFEQGTSRLAVLDSTAAMSILPKIISAFMPQLCSPMEGVCRGTAHAVRVMIASCIDESAIDAAAALRQDEEKEGLARQRRFPLSPLRRIFVAVEYSLSPQYQDGWEYSLGIAAELIENVGRDGAFLSSGLLTRIGEICTGGDDLHAGTEGVATDWDEDTERVLVAAQDALGVALRVFGPEHVLDVLPLMLEEGLVGKEQARTWLLPLLRMHVRNARIGYWMEAMFPLARRLGGRAAHAKGTSSREQEMKVCLALERQIWATLPSFCSWPNDAAEAFEGFTNTLKPIFENRPDLRIIICRSLRRLCIQTRKALSAHGHPIGFADPSFYMEDESGSNHQDNQYNNNGDYLAGQDNDDDSNGILPLYATPDQAQQMLQMLQSHSRMWLPLLLNAFIQTPANQRVPLQAAVAGYACLCDAKTLSTLFKAAITKLMKVMQQAKTGELGRDAVLEGGYNDTERQGTFMEVALALSGGVDASGILVVYKAVVPGTKDKDPAIQKKAYKILAYVCESRPDYYRETFTELLVALLQGQPTAVSAAKRYRLQCLKAVLLETLDPDGPEIDFAVIQGRCGSSHAALLHISSVKSQQVQQLITPIVSEIVLCLKEANKKTRTAAYDVIVEIAHAMHAVQPPSMETGEGGLKSLVNIVLSGLVGVTPHMISGSVMALARLLFEFAPVLAGFVPDLLPAVLMLLRSKAREVIKSVLGFLRVVARRMPVDQLQHFIPAILEGILSWAEDSKNKFRQKVRIIVERLAIRCGFEAMDAAIPPAHRPLLTHIRKAHNRKETKRGESLAEWDGGVDAMEGDGGDDDGDIYGGMDKKSLRSSGKTARTTAARSAWASDIFSDDDEYDGDDDVGRGIGGMRGKHNALTVRSTGSRRQGNVAKRSVRSAPINAQSARRLPSSGDPMDLLDTSASRRMLRGASGRGTNQRTKKGLHNDGDDDENNVEFVMGDGGRMIIPEEEEDVKRNKKRNRDAVDAGFDSDDSDFEDLKGISGISLALRDAKSVNRAPSMVAGSLSGRKSITSDSVGRGGNRGGEWYDHQKQKRRHARGEQHSGDRFKSKKEGAGGDVKGGSKVEPYAYWPLDKKLMNRRAQKARNAKAGLDKVVNAAKEGAVKGRKAKRMRR